MLKTKQLFTVPCRRILCSRALNQHENAKDPSKNELPTFSEGGPLIRTTQDPFGIRRVTMNNPKRRNALSLEMMESLYESLNIDEKTRVVIIKAVGTVFSSGHDLKVLTNKQPQAKHEEIFRFCSQLMTRIQDLRVPVIAQVDGLAAAAGCQLVATCDMAVASQIASFSTPGVHVGFFCSTPGIALARAIPSKVALEMLYTGHVIGSEVALRHGLVSRVYPANQLSARTTNIAEQIAKHSKPVIAMGKKFFYEQVEMSRNEAYRHGEKVMVQNLQLDDAQQGINNFLTKLPMPKWTDK